MRKISPEENFLHKFQNSIIQGWYSPALSDYKHRSYNYGELARELEKNRLFYSSLGICKGDKIAINARSSAAWAIAFFSVQCYGAVSVQLFPGFTAADTQKLIVHSDSRILYTEKAIFAGLDFSQMPSLLGAIDIASGEVLASRGEFELRYSELDTLFHLSYPLGFEPKDIDYSSSAELDALCSIMYTSGSTGNPKGVMLTNRNLSAQVAMLPHHIPLRKGNNLVSILPFSHIFGMTVDMICPLCHGMQLIVLGLPPVPQNLKPALRQYKPHSFFTVPLVLNKLVDDTLGEFINSESGKTKLAAYKSNPDFCEALHTIFMSALGGNIELLVSGGAAIPSSVEELFVRKLALPLVTGYGMSETAPVIAVGHKENYKLGECGEVCDEIFDLKIDSPSPGQIPGEILVKGESVFCGYYKNDSATQAAFSPDGWFRTGDLATIDSDGSLFIVGRCKSMILTSNGQNIFPEEIEVQLNTLPGVSESLIVERDERLVALIVPDQSLIANMDARALSSLMDANLALLNKSIPGYCHVCAYELKHNPFEKTPKGSIKRYMYK